jgi:hypothetical protein
MTERGLRRFIRAGAVLLACSVAILGLAVAASADHVPPVARNDNPRCTDIDEGFEELFVNTANGEFGDGTVTVTVTNYETETFDWATDQGIDAVIVWGGPDGIGSSVYSYESTETSDENAHALADPQGGYYPTFHFLVCYEAPSTEPTEEPTVEPIDEPTEEPEEPEEPGEEPEEPEETGEPTATPTTTVLGRRFLPATGTGGLVPMALTGLIVLALGSGAYLVASREVRSR